MKTYHLHQALLVLILLACLSGAYGQYNTPTSGYSTVTPVSGTAQNNASQYSQYYQMLNGPVPSNHISAPQQFDITGNMPSTVFFGNQAQPVNYAQYASSPSYTGSSSLWVQGSTSWAQYAVVPQGATVNLLAITPTPGSGYFYFTDSNGQMYTYNYYFYPYSRMTLYADNPGRHVLSFAVNGMMSNQVTIDVTGVYTPPTNYLPPAYYPTYYPNYYSPGYYYPAYYYPGYFYPGYGGGIVMPVGSATTPTSGATGTTGGTTTGTTGGTTGESTQGATTGTTSGATQGVNQVANQAANQISKQGATQGEAQEINQAVNQVASQISKQGATGNVAGIGTNTTIGADPTGGIAGQNLSKENASESKTK